MAKVSIFKYGRNDNGHGLRNSIVSFLHPDKFIPVTIFREFTFDSAHYLPKVAEGHKCRNLHGHTYRLVVYISGPLQEEGWVMDFAVMKTIIGDVLDKIDHKLLNEIEGLDNPTCENVSIWLWQRIKPSIPQLEKIKLNETPGSGAIYEGD